MKNMGLAAFANEMIDVAFEGGDLGGHSIQEMAVKHGLLEETRFDPEKHKDLSGYVQAGDPWFVLAGPLATPSPSDHEPIGYVSTQTLADLLHDNSGEYKITATHDLMSDDMIAIYTAPEAHPSTPAPKDHVTVPDGWKLVPIEPTLAMVMAGENAHDRQLARLDTQPRKDYPSEETAELCCRVAYRAMIGAAPSPEGDQS